MNISDTSNKKKKPVTPQFKDVSRFTRFINQMDNRDLQMDPKKRKRKWLVVLSVLLALYLLSFLIPTPDFSHKDIETGRITIPQDSIKNEKQKKLESLSFEMPVDSFENLLKQRIHESIPEKK